MSPYAFESSTSLTIPLVSKILEQDHSEYPPCHWDKGSHTPGQSFTPVTSSRDHLYPHNYNIKLSWPRRKVALPGCQSCLWMTTVFTSTRGPSGMRFASAMLGPCQPYPPSVTVALLSLPPMPWSAPWEAFQPYGTTKYATSQLPCWAQSVTMSPLNPVYLNGESMRLCSTTTADEACLDILARGFWSTAQDAYFDVRVSTQMHPAITQNPCLRCTRDMKTSKSVCAASVFMKLSTGFSLRWFYPPQVAWAAKPPLFTSGWQTCLRPTRGGCTQ